MNENEEMLPFLLSVKDILEDDGYLFMVVRCEEGKLPASYKEIDNIKYDREVYGYSKDLFEKKMKDNFIFVKEEVPHNEHWKYYFYKKKENQY